MEGPLKETTLTTWVGLRTGGSWRRVLDLWLEHAAWQWAPTGNTILINWLNLIILFHCYLQVIASKLAIYLMFWCLFGLRKPHRQNSHHKLLRLKAVGSGMDENFGHVFFGHAKHGSHQHKNVLSHKKIQGCNRLHLEVNCNPPWADGRPSFCRQFMTWPSEDKRLYVGVIFQPPPLPKTTCSSRI